MIQLSFEPAYDAYCTIFRLMRMRAVIRRVERVPLLQLRILDFYLQFPCFIGTIRLKPEQMKFKKLAKEYSGTRPYGRLSDKRVMFDRMRTCQEAAAHTLVAKGYFERADFEVGQMRPSSQHAPLQLTARVDEINEEERDLIELLEQIATYRLDGDGGLKDRSGLAEFRYDAI